MPNNVAIQVKSVGNSPNLQEVSVRSTINTQIITPETRYEGFSKVTVEAIEQNGRLYQSNIALSTNALIFKYGTILNECCYLEYSVPSGYLRKALKYLTAGYYNFTCRMSNNNLWLFATVGITKSNGIKSFNVKGEVIISSSYSISNVSSILSCNIINGSYYLFPDDFSKIYMPLMNEQNSNITTGTGINRGSANFSGGLIVPISTFLS